MNQDNEVDENQRCSSWRMLVLATLLALVVRSYGISEQSFTNDEVIDIEIARMSWSEIMYQADGFPPLHHLILKVSLLLTDWDMAGRWLSLLYGVLAVPITGLLAMRIAGKRCGALAAGLLAIAPLHVYFSQEARSYSLFFLLSVLAVWLFWRAIENDTPRDWTIFAIGASLGGYAHYFACFTLFALGMIWLQHTGTTGKWRTGLMAFVGIGVLSLPLFVLVGADIGNQQKMRQGDFDIAAVAYTGWALLTGYCVGPSLRELHSMGSKDAVQAILPWLLPVGAVACGLLASLFRKGFPRRWELLTLFVVPIGCACFAATMLQISFYNVRYVIPSLLPLVVMLAVAMSRENKKLAILLGLVFVMINGVSLTNRIRLPTHRNEDSRAACAYLAAHAEQPQRVFSLAHYMQSSARYYLPSNYQVIPMADVTAEPSTLEAAIELINEQDGPFWVFYSREFHGDPEGIFKQSMLKNPQVTLEKSYEGVELFRGVAPIRFSLESLQQ